MVHMSIGIIECPPIQRLADSRSGEMSLGEPGFGLFAILALWCCERDQERNKGVVVRKRLSAVEGGAQPPVTDPAHQLAAF